MAESANVSSIDAVAKFAAALRLFEEQSANALLSIDDQARGALQWVEHDAAAYWRGQVRKGFEDVSRTRAELLACRSKATKDYKPSCIDEMKAHRAAQARLQHAEEQVEVVRRWAQRLQREVDEYRGRVQRLRQCLETDVPRTLALLDRTAISLEKYVDRPVPASETPDAGDSPDQISNGDSA